MSLWNNIDRRDFLRVGMAGLVGIAAPTLLTSGEAYASNGGRWRVSFENAHTHERFSGVYRVGDQYLPEAFEKINRALRDHRTGEMFPMDPHVIDIMSRVQGKVGRGHKLHVLSGYRSPKTNNMLRGKTRGVAKNSFHMYGQALDLRMDDVGASRIRSAARGLRAGGVGYYPRRNFTHVDTGDVRTWTS